LTRRDCGAGLVAVFRVLYLWWVEIVAQRGDITQLDIDAIVNAANSTLLGGGGVDGAIHRAAGPELLAACKEIRRTRLPDGLPVGEAIATPGFGLPARWVIHTVGPNWHVKQRDPEDLAACFANSLTASDEVGAHSVAFPAISAGVYGWAPDVVAKTAVQAVRDWAAAHPDSTVSHVRFVLFSPELHAVFNDALAQ